MGEEGQKKHLGKGAGGGRKSRFREEERGRQREDARLAKWTISPGGHHTLDRGKQ